MCKQHPPGLNRPLDDDWLFSDPMSLDEDVVAEVSWESRTPAKPGCRSAVYGLAAVLLGMAGGVAGGGAVVLVAASEVGHGMSAALCAPQARWRALVPPGSTDKG